MKIKANRLSLWFDAAGLLGADRVLVAMSYAGGSGRAFLPWIRCMPPGWALVMVELPGHGRRLMEPPLASTAEIVDALLDELSVLPAGARLSLAGYSFGGLVALELARALSAEGKAPEALVMCATRAPHTGLGHEPVTTSPPGQIFLERAVKEGLAAPEMLTVPALAQHFGMALYRDLVMVENYPPSQVPLPPVPLCVIGAANDRLCPPASLLAWGALSDRPPLHRWVPGEHMALTDDPERVAEAVWEGLAELLAPQQGAASSEDWNIPSH